MEKPTTLTLSTASKTFLVGEYLALAGGPAIVLNTEPRFTLTAKKTNGEVQLNGISETSPAGQFILANKESFQNRELIFNDPHEGRGGFGASSAQFALAYSLSGRSGTAEDVMDCYLEHAWNGDGPAPSGCDVIAQLFGGEITFIDHKTEQIKSAAWLFDDLCFSLVRTGQKIATHEHLNNLRLRELEPFRLPVRMTWQGLVNSDEEMFLEGLNKFSHHLSRKEWIADNTIELLKSFDDVTLTAKGCGALGADVLLLTYRPEQREAVHNKAKDLSLEVIATEENLCNGFESNAKTELKELEL